MNLLPARFLFFSLVLLLVFSCKKTGDKNVATNLDEEKDLLSLYFDAATSGVISVAEPFHYILKSPLTADVPESVLQGVIRLDPAVKGKVALSNRSILTFTPDAPLKSNTVYQVTLDLPVLDKKVFPTKITYSVQTIEQQIRLEKQGFVLKDNGEVEVLVQVKSADILDITSLEKCFDAKNAKINIVETANNNYQAVFIYPTISKSKTNIEFEGSAVQAESEETITPFDINPNRFEIITTFHDKENKEMNLYFSKILDGKQDLTGLLAMGGQTPDYARDQNVLKVFLDETSGMNVIEIFINQGLKSRDGNTLSQDYTYSLENKAHSPAVEFLSSGNYFPSEGDFKIPVKTRGLDELKVVVIEIKQENVMHFLAWHSLEYSDYYSLRMYGKPIFDDVVALRDGLVDADGFSVYGIDLTKQVKKNPGSIYHVSLDFLPENTSLACKGKLEKYKVQFATPNNEYFYSKQADIREEYIYYPDYNWDKNTDPCDISFYAYKQPAQKLLICSDFSVIAKKAGVDYHVAINTLNDLSPVSGAEVTLFDLQAEKTGSSTTSGDGFAKIKGTKQNGAVLRIDKGTQTTYLSLDEADSNPLTEYDVSGEMSEIETEAFIYTDRDVWRPGDSIYVNVMFHAKNAAIPPGLPLTCSFLNTDNVQIMEQAQAIHLSQKQIYTFVLHTSSVAKTGRYRCVLRWGTRSHRQNIQVETIKPNTIETILDLDNMENKVVYASSLSGSLSTQYLTGFKAPQTLSKAVGKYYALSNPFPDYGTYAFTIPGINTSGNIDLFEVKTDDSGKSSFQTGYDFKAANSPGNLHVEVESILQGGGNNKEGKTFKISPFLSYLGAERKPGSGWAGNHTFKENVDVNLVRLDKYGKLMNTSHPVSYTIYKHVEHWWIDKYRLTHWGNFQQDDLWAFVRSDEVSISGKGKVQVTKGSLAKGAYKIVFNDEHSGHQTAVFFTVYDGMETIPGKQAHLIELMTEKDEYAAGESISLRLPDIKGAKALISVERGKEIIQQAWHVMKEKNNLVNIKSSESWTPNVYIHVTIVQPFKQLENDLPMRMYGVKSIKFTGKSKPLTPVTNLAATIESEKKYSFTVSEVQGREMEYTLALVDEGLLSLKGFKTPDPHDHFHGKYPLLVKTWDIYKYLMSFFSGQFAGIISIGGDDAYKADALQEVNRFKPVVIHRGPYKLAKGGKNKHTIEIPRYIGKLRLMVVACNAETFGHLEKMILVKNPIMVQTQYPRNLQVTDKVTLPVQIFRDDPSIQSAVLTATLTNPILKGLPVDRKINFGKDNMAKEYAVLEVLNKPGKTMVDMTVKGNGKSMTEKTEMVVQYPNAYASKVERHVILPGKSVVFEISPLGYPEVFSSRFLVSGVKAPDFMTFAERLIDYPYGCLEQVTSNGFGQIYLDKLLDLDPAVNQKRLEHIRVITNKINVHQKGGGSFYYWDNDYYHSWSDMYAGHLLLEMKNLGYLPKDNRVFQDWLNHTFQKANQWSVSNSYDPYYYESEAMSHAYRLYVLAKAGKPAKSAMNRFMTNCRSKNPMVWWLLGGSFSQSGFDSKALEMIAKAEKMSMDQNSNWYGFSFGSQARDLAIIVEILSGMEGQKSKMDRYFDAMVDAYNNSDWNSTQDMGYACIATYAYYRDNLALNKDVQYSVSGLKAMQNFKHKASTAKSIRVDQAYLNKKIEIKNTGNSVIHVSDNRRYIDQTLVKSAEEKDLKMTVTYYNKTQKTPGLTEVRLGDDILITVVINNRFATPLKDMALNVVLPSGLELINPRLYQTEVSNNNSGYQYQDYKDDRVYTFFEIGPGKNSNYEFRAKAAFSGDFYLPRIVCENMYRGDVYAKTASGRLVIRE